MSTTMNRKYLAAVAAASLAFTLAACTPDNEQDPTPTTPAETGGPTEEPLQLSGALNGAGATAQESAMETWRAGFQTLHPDVTVNYDGVGSGGGRTQFLDGATSFAGTDSLMGAEEYDRAIQRCGPAGAIHLPIYISPIAVIFNLDGVDSLDLTADLIAQIFNGDITQWNDPAIAALNSGVDLPSLPITVVFRSDNSGTTGNFTDYLAKASSTWPHDPSGDWPLSAGESGAGTSAIVQIVSDTVGTIGYVDASRAGSLGTVALGVGDTFVPFSSAAAAAAVLASPIAAVNGEHDLAFQLARDTTTAGAYPLVLISYHIVCLSYADEAEGNLLVGFLKYVASDEGQNASAAAAGSAPIGPELGALVNAAIDAIEVG